MVKISVHRTVGTKRPLDVIERNTSATPSSSGSCGLISSSSTNMPATTYPDDSPGPETDEDPIYVAARRGQTAESVGANSSNMKASIDSTNGITYSSISLGDRCDILDQSQRWCEGEVQHFTTIWSLFFYIFS